MAIKRSKARALYAERPLADGHPDIEARALCVKSEASPRPNLTVDTLLKLIGRAMDLPIDQKTAAIVGCGPVPTTVKRFTELGWSCVGVEPVDEFVSSAREYLGQDDAILKGCAEDLPLADCSQTIVFMENVLEHVDSPLRSLDEAYRVLAPGGVLYITTTNRLRITNGEYAIPFYQWLPRLVKESYIHQHLHFEPKFARYSSRPAVHWFSYADLCDLGRTAGFHRFYSRLDLSSNSDSEVRRGRLRRAAASLARYNPWLRSLALTQIGGNIFMLKRRD